MVQNEQYTQIKQQHQKLYTEYSAEYEERTKNAYSTYLLPFIESFLDNLKIKNILDLGCGPGRDLAYFKEKGYNPIGIDLSEGMINRCKQKGLKVIHTDFMNLPFEDNHFGGVWAYTSLTLIPKEEFLQVIEKIAKILTKDGGVLALGMIEGDYEGWKNDYKYPDHNRFIFRMSASNLHHMLKNYFNTVDVQRVPDPKNNERVYLHAICKHIPVDNSPKEAARQLFNKYASTYESRTLSGIKLLEKDRQTFLSYIKPGGNILDLGSGPGRDSEIFKKQFFNPVAFDISDENVKLCEAKGIKAQVGDINQVGNFFDKNSFDGIWANCSLTNWIPAEKIDEAIQQILPLLKKSGVIFIGSVVGNFSGWEINEKYDQMPRYNNHWDAQELKSLLFKFGLKDLVYERVISEEESNRKPYLNLIYKI